VPGTGVAPVKHDGISGQQSSHETREFNLIAAQQEVAMIGEQSPSKTVGTGFCEKAAIAVDELFPVVIVQINIRAFNSPNNDMLH